MIEAESIAQALNGKPKTGGGWMCHCPAHDDRTPSLSIDQGDNDTPLLKCFSGCTQTVIIDELKARNLWPETQGQIVSKEDLEQAQKRSAQRKADRQKKYDKAAAIALSVWKKATPAKKDHPYLLKKQVKPTSTLKEIDLDHLKKLIGYNPPAKGEPLADSRILIAPVIVDGRVITLEFIDQAGRKSALAGGQKSGGYWATTKLPKNDSESLRIVIGEGIATVLSSSDASGFPAIATLSCGNLISVAKQIRDRYPKATIIILADIVKTTGLSDSHAEEAARQIGGRLAIPDFGPDRPEKATDFNDLAALKGLDAVKACIEAALQPGHNKETVPDSTEPFYTATVERLAALSPIEYEQVRKDQAKELGIRTTALDQIVKATIKDSGLSNDLPFKDVPVWPEPVNPAAILSEITATVRRFIVCNPEISTAVSLWAAMTWLMDSIHVAPLAVITAPEKRCGKSQLLTLIGRLSCRPITASSISPAALFRAIDAWEPTLLIDEVDACMKDNEELRGIINSGHTRDSAYVIRTVGDTFTPTKFNTWGAKALSGIGHVADTLMDRAIILELRRKLQHENVDRLRYAEPGLFETLASKLARFAQDYCEQVRQARPYLPPSLNDRAQDNWEPLLAIAMVAGPEWLETATKTALKISGNEAAAQSIGVELLTDISEIFEMKAVDRIGTAELIKALVDDDEKPWATFSRGFPIKPRQLANRLKGYGISSKTIRLNSLETPKGYEKRQFEEAFSRYIPSPPSVSATTPQINSHKGLGVADNPTRCVSVADKNNRRCPEKLGCGVVADRTPPLNNTIVEVEL